MTERRRPYRRRRTTGKKPEGDANQDNPYRDADAPSGDSEGGSGGPPPAATFEGGGSEAPSAPSEPAGGEGGNGGGDSAPRPESPYQGNNGGAPQQGGAPWQQGGGGGRRNGRRGRRGRFRDRQGNSTGEGSQGGGQPQGGFNNNQQQQQQPVVADGEVTGWFDPSRDGGFVRRAGSSYLAEPTDPWMAPWQVRQLGLRKSDKVAATTGRDFRGRTVVVDVTAINDADPTASLKRADFAGLVASYPDRKLILESGKPAKGGPELTRRAIDLISPIGYGQRALIVAPARAGKTMLMHAVTEGISMNHPNAVLLILLVDERPEEVSEAISWGVGEVIASSFDQPAKRHVEVTEMVLERARRLVELGKDVIIVLDSLTRMARAHNTAERGTGRTMSGGLDSSAMAKPKAFFGSARAVSEANGGGSLTIIATALVETGSRMDDVIFEEFKGTGNCEIKLDRSLAEKRIFPAIDIATSGTRREDKLFRPDQLEHVHMLRRGLGQMPPQAAMEWLIKRIANTTNNDALLEGL
jgi:transcription termination factor Rho